MESSKWVLQCNLLVREPIESNVFDDLCFLMSHQFWRWCTSVFWLTVDESWHLHTSHHHNMQMIWNVIIIQWLAVGKHISQKWKHSYLVFFQSLSILIDPCYTFGFWHSLLTLLLLEKWHRLVAREHFKLLFFFLLLTPRVTSVTQWITELQGNETRAWRSADVGDDFLAPAQIKQVRRQRFHLEG